MNISKLAACAALLVVCLGANVNLARAQSLPSPWTARDVGAPVLGGSATHSSGVFDIDAAGADIWGTSDQFHFVYQPVSGDIDLRARVDSLTAANEWSKAGVMIRSSLSASAAHAYALVSASRGVAFQRRQAAGGTSTHTGGMSAAAPQWVRVVRSGMTVTAFSSSNGVSWTTIASDTIQLGATAYVGIAVTSHNAAMRTTALVSNVTLTSAATPVGETSADVGSPSIAGSTALAAGKYTVTSAGTGLSTSADQFRYVYRLMTGDVDVVARVESLSPEGLRTAVAGVMIRESLTPGSRHAFVAGSLVKGIDLRFRRDADVPSEYVDGPGMVPAWVRLVRTGSLFEAFRSVDGTNWTKIGSATINMSDTSYVGIAVTSQNSTTPATAIVSGLKITAAAAPTPSNTPPAIILNSPANGTSFVAPASVTMTAAASDADGTVAAVDFYANSNMVGRDSAAPYAFTLSSLPAGTHTLKAVATDNQGAQTASSSVDVVVSAPTSNKPPTIVLSSPANGTSLIAPASVTITATASDADGTVASVDFYANSTLIGKDTTAPYAFTLSSLAAGTYTLKAVATDNQGAQTVSSSVSIVVANSSTGTGSWSVVFQASANHSTAVTNYVLEIYAVGATPGSSTPVATSNLGKPTPASTGDITVDRSTFFQGLAAGNYVATVCAVGSAGVSRSASVSFTR